MSIDLDAAAGTSPLPECDLETRYGPRPAAHGAAVMAVFDDLDGPLDPGIYQRCRQLWYDKVGDRDDEGAIVAELDDSLEWLPPARNGRDWVVTLRSSRWKAGTGEGDDYSAWYKYHLTLRELDNDGERHKPPLALSLRVEPQDTDLVYKDGSPLECPYGEGSRVVLQSTWADSSEELERRMTETLQELLDVDGAALEAARVDRSRRVQKAEAHHRFSVDAKRRVVEILERSKGLIEYGGSSEIEANQRRIKEGYLEAAVSSDRWDLLGFTEVDFDVELKIYQATNWTDIPASEPGHHPKIEASFDGVADGRLPHVDEWDQVMRVLRTMVNSHLFEWAEVDRSDLVADDFQDGPGLPEWSWSHPVGRVDQLRARYKSLETQIYREATSRATKSVYDILRVVAEERGATYDVLEERVGLSRSCIRYHVRRLQESGVVDRVGNPVLVVFPSIQVLRSAEEIMRECYPDDTIEAAMSRAEDRRDRREQLQDESNVDDGDRESSDDADQEGGDAEDSSTNSTTWRYFDDLALEPGQLAAALDRDHIDADHVRVRTDPYSWVG